MAHYAKLDEANAVLGVIVVANSEEMGDGQMDEARGIAFCVSLTGHPSWKKTSYNASIRKNYAGIGFVYDAARDAFIPPKPFSSWVLDEVTCQWQAPVPMPDGGPWAWDEGTLGWIPGGT